MMEELSDLNDLEKKIQQEIEGWLTRTGVGE
jgi:hypothetical protein